MEDTSNSLSKYIGVATIDATTHLRAQTKWQKKIIQFVKKPQQS